MYMFYLLTKPWHMLSVSCWFGVIMIRGVEVKLMTVIIIKMQYRLRKSNFTCSCGNISCCVSNCWLSNVLTRTDFAFANHYIQV